MRLVCQCGNTLAVLNDGMYLITHRGRRISARQVELIVCEDCRTPNRLAPSEPATPSEPSAASMSRESVG